jgi:RHS repeat-associated protein
VTSATAGQSVAPVKTFSYDAIGNLLSKSDVGNYSYPLAGSALPHAVTSISGGAVSASFAYDPNGNQTTGLGRSISYTSYNKPSSITQGSSTLFFSDDTDHQRFKQVSPQGTTLYFTAFGVHTELFTAATSQWYDYIGSGGSMLGVRVQSASSVTTRYFQTDNLGSIAVITDESGNVVERDSYDAWGKRRFPNGADDPSGSLTSQTTRGFTGQEELADVGLVHLNGRVYDPLIGRMMSADPFVPDPMNGQAWNRYSYVINNPLALTDTNGYCFLGMCSWGKAISTFFNRTFGALFRAVPLLGSLLEIAASALCLATPVCQPFAAVVAGLTTSFVAGVTSGSLSYALKAGLIAGITAAANFEIGTLTQGLSIPVEGLGSINPLNIAGHALVGCASAVASGGKCGPSALAGGISAVADPFIAQKFPDPLNNPGNLAAGTAISATIGGLASVAGGGKFANGAMTAAFGYLFNQVVHENNKHFSSFTGRDGRQITITFDPGDHDRAVSDRLYNTVTAIMDELGFTSYRISSTTDGHVSGDHPVGNAVDISMIGGVHVGTSGDGDLYAQILKNYAMSVYTADVRYVEGPGGNFVQSSPNSGNWAPSRDLPGMDGHVHISVYGN